MQPFVEGAPLKKMFLAIFQYLEQFSSSTYMILTSTNSPLQVHQ